MFLNKLFKKKHEMIIDADLVPKHVAIIMDGNGRWAKRRAFPRIMGHREGANNLKKITTLFRDFGVKYLTVYAFSTENWLRPKEEVSGLMDLLYDYLKNAEKELGNENIRIKIIGDVSKLPEKVRNEAIRVTEITKNNDAIDLNIALNYGSRHEIVQAVNKIIKDVKDGEITTEEISEKDISNRLYTSKMPELDLLIRTSGELRISNYLLWQAAYAEFWFTDVLWPDFDREDVIQALEAYRNRKRRYGGI